MTADEKRHLDRLAAMPCAVCGIRGPSQVHHPRAFAGMGQRASHWLAVPLCPDCHQGPTGIHGDRSAWRVRKLDEPAVLADTIRRLMSA